MLRVRTLIAKSTRPTSSFLLHAGTKRHLSLAYALHEPSSVEVEPAKEPIIILHGLFGSKQNNRSISKALARDLKTAVYAVDLRNHGDSPHHPEHTYSKMADDIEEFVEEHGISRPTLIGHSMGAKVAMAVALRSPDLVKSLIPVDNAPADVSLNAAFRKYIEGMLEIEGKSIKKQAEADEILKRYEESLPIRQFLLTNLTKAPKGSSNDGSLHLRVPVKILASHLGSMGDFPFKDPDLAHYDGPTLFIRGSKSKYVPDDVFPLLGQFFPRFEVRDVDSGHWVISEKPEEFRRAVVEFLQPHD